MYIIQQSPAPGGAFPPIQSWQGATPPEGFDQWPDELERETFQQYSGFVVTTVARGVVKSYEPNLEAYEQWRAQQAGTDQEPEENPEGEVPSWSAMAEAVRQGVNGV